MIGNCNFVCPECRTNRKQDPLASTPACPGCRKPMINLGKNTRVGKKSDHTFWRWTRDLKAWRDDTKLRMLQGLPVGHPPSPPWVKTRELPLTWGYRRKLRGQPIPPRRYAS